MQPTQKIPFALEQSLQQNMIYRDDLGEAQQLITQTILEKRYSDFSISPFSSLDETRVCQLFHITFFWCFASKKIKCTVENETVNGESKNITPHSSALEDAKLRAETRIKEILPQFFQFTVVQRIDTDKGVFIDNQSAVGKVELIPNECGHPQLLEVVQSALLIINKNMRK